MVVLSIVSAGFVEKNTQEEQIELSVPAQTAPVSEPAEETALPVATEQPAQ
jgi:hypothetical protein